jgi:nucleotide-binding universal stress UspA family protein
MKILIAYDGSPDAKNAVTLAGDLFDGTPAVVLTVWEGFSQVISRAEAGLTSALDFEQIDAAAERAAHKCAEEGTGHARVSGLPAESRVVRRHGTTWETILEQAADIDADIIVLGSRGLSGVKSLLLGSVSRAVLQHSDRPVLVSPANRTAAKGRHPHPAPSRHDSAFFSARL